MEKTNPTAADASVDHDNHQDLLDDLMAQVAPCFARRETRLTCKDMVHGLLSELSLLEAGQAVRATRSAMKEPAMSPASSAARVITA